MSKFDELCSAAESGHLAALKHRELCVEFATNLIQGFIEYLSIPLSKYHLIAASKSAVSFLQSEGNRSTSIAEALQLADNSFWHIQIELDLRMANTEPLPRRVLLEFSFIRNENIFRVSLDHTGEHFDIEPTRGADFKKFYDHVCQEVKGTLTKSVTRLLINPKVLRIDSSPET